MSIDIRGMTPLLQVFDMPTSLDFYCDVLGVRDCADGLEYNPTEPQLGVAEAERD